MTQLWLIERDVSGWSDDDLKAAAIRATVCMPWYANMVWVRSFYDRAAARTLCIYRADTEADIRTHAVAAGLPCGAVSPVEEVLADEFDESRGADPGAASRAPVTGDDPGR